MMFDYDATFVRNIGIITEEERTILKETKISILGVGGIGGRFAESLVRLGCENLLITDTALFDPPDLNRQFSTNQESLDKSKAEWVGKAMKEINPELNLKIVSGGVTLENYTAIVEQSDLIVDAIDVNCGLIKQRVNQYAYECGKPVVSGYLVGHGAINLVFDKRYGVSFDEYFGFDHDEKQEIFFQKLVKGIYPNVTSDKVYNDAADRLLQGKGHIPSCTANSYVAGALGTMAIRGVLLGRPQIPYAPNYQQIDLYDMRYYLDRYDYQAK